MKLATHLHLALILRPLGAVPPLTYTPYGLQEAKIVTVLLLLPHWSSVILSFMFTSYLVENCKVLGSSNEIDYDS
jgi:hypothetical protein